MKIKRLLPVIVLFLLSLAVLIITPAILYFTSEYPKDPALKLSMNLRQGLSLAAFILVPLWIGAGADALLARIKDGLKRRVASLAFYLGAFFICIALPILSIFIIYGSFSVGDSWKQLPAPPETPVAVAAGSRSSVVIETESGNYYYCIVDNDLCWQPENKPASPVIGGEDYSTQATGNMPQSAPPGKIVSMLGIAYSNGPSKSESHYAILENGTIWYLNREVNNYAGGFIAGLAAIVIVPFVIGSAILIAGTGISAFTRWLASLFWREPKTE